MKRVLGAFFILVILLRSVIRTIKTLYVLLQYIMKSSAFLKNNQNISRRFTMKVNIGVIVLYILNSSHLFVFTFFYFKYTEIGLKEI